MQKHYTPVNLVRDIIDLRVGTGTNVHACKPARADIRFENIIYLLMFCVGPRRVKTQARFFGQNSSCRTPFCASLSARNDRPVVTVRRSQRTFRIDVCQSPVQGPYKHMARPFYRKIPKRRIVIPLDLRPRATASPSPLDTTLCRVRVYVANVPTRT